MSRGAFSSIGAVAILLVVALAIVAVGLAVRPPGSGSTGAGGAVTTSTAGAERDLEQAGGAGMEAGSTVTTSTTATEASAPESAVLPSMLPADAVKVKVPILMYHYVDATPPPAGPYADSLTVRTKDFKAEMTYLVANGYHTVSLSDVYLAMAGRKRLPGKPVVLTFDDGGLDNFTVAFPVLEQHGLTATFFVITGRVGKEGQMEWRQLREMAARGMSIQSHSVSHPDLRGVSAARLKSELVDSRTAIAEAIGLPSYVLCYPSGAYNDRVIKAARSAGYVMAVTTDRGREGDPSAVFELHRRRVPAFLPPASFANLLR